MSGKDDDPPDPGGDRTIFQPGRPVPKPMSAPSPGVPPPPQPGPSTQGGLPPSAGQVPPAQPAGAAPPPAGAMSSPPPPPGGPARLEFAASDPELFGPEQLVAAAGRLIHLASQVKMMPIGPDLNELRALVVRELSAFSNRAKGLGLDTKTIQLAHYILCAFMDDAVMSTPWGANSQWSQQSLLIAYHNDAQGGDRLFVFADRMIQDPDREPRLMELLYQCLSLGFEGRAALDPRTAASLNERRTRLAAAIASRRAALTGELSPQWRGVEAKGGRYEPRIPLWTILAIMCAIAFIIFAALYFRLSSRTDAALAALGQVVGTADIQPPPPPPPEARTDMLESIRQILAPDVSAGRLSIISQGNDIVLRLNNDKGLFRPASATPESGWSDTFGRLAQAANLTKGPIRIEGHTDNQALTRSLQFPSNMELSQARAQAVADAVTSAGLADASRVATRGLSDAQPIADNNTVDGRRQNRRVELHVANDINWR